MTVSQLRKSLRGIRGNMPIYIADHDHGNYEFNGNLGSVIIVDQNEMDEWERKRQDEIHKVIGKYLILKVG